jgi:hypothetical protein
MLIEEFIPENIPDENPDTTEEDGYGFYPDTSF